MIYISIGFFILGIALFFYSLGKHNAQKKAANEFIKEINDIMEESKKNYEEIEKMETGNNNDDFFNSLDVLSDIEKRKSK